MDSKGSDWKDKGKCLGRGQPSRMRGVQKKKAWVPSAPSSAGWAPLPPAPCPGKPRRRAGQGWGHVGGVLGPFLFGFLQKQPKRKLAGCGEAGWLAARFSLTTHALRHPSPSSSLPPIWGGPRCIPVLGTRLRVKFPLGGEFSSRAGMEGAAGVSPVPLTCEECRESRVRHPRSGTLRERQLQAFREDRTG